MLTRLLLALFLSLILVWPASGQGPIYLPIIEATMVKPLKSTIGIVSPVEDQNYVLNPSAEIAGNFTAMGGATVTRSAAFQKYGLYSYEVTTTGGGDRVEFDLLELPAIDVYVTFRARGTANIQIDVNMSGTGKEAVLLERIDSEWGLYGVIFPASLAGGEASVEIEQTSNGANTFYIDGVQVSRLIDGRYYTTYIDGTQEGARWQGAPHASASVRSADSRAGGVVTSFWEGFNFFPEKALGMGTAVEELNIDSYAFLPGGELNSSKIPPREFTIIGYFLADTVEELHEHAQRLELELGLNTYPGRQPVRLRYSGARVLKEISANYTGGLEGDLPIFYNDDWSQEDEAWVRNFRFKMRASISFVALDPFWYEVGESAILLDTNDEAEYEKVAVRLLNTGWSPLGAPDALGNAALVLAEDAEYIYIGGDFTNWDGIASADYIVRYHKTTGVYSAMAALNGIVRAIAILPNGDVVIGGEFTNASGVALADYIAVWAVGASAFTALGDPVTGASIQRVQALIVANNGLLYIGGGFDNWAGIAAADHLVAWNGSGYEAVSTGTDNVVLCFANGPGTILYVGGTFDTAGGVTANNIAMLDTSTNTFTDMDEGVDDNVNDIIVKQNGNVIAGGEFINAGTGPLTVGYVAEWNGANWFDMAGGVNDVVFALAIAPNSAVILGGRFTGTVSGLTLADGVTIWNGFTYSHVDWNPETTADIFDILVSQYDTDPLVASNYQYYLATNLGNALAQSSGLQTADNEGTISAFPKIIFSRSGGTTATIETLRNERTGRELLFNYSLLDGESLTIDLNPKNRTIISSFFGPRMSAVLANSDLSTWQLLPRENPISSFVSEDGSPTITAYLLWREPYRGWN